SVPGYFTLILMYLSASIGSCLAPALWVMLGKVMDMYREGIRDARTISYLFLILATGLVLWSTSSFILASNADLEFGIGMVGSVQKLAISAIGAILITVIGINVSKRIATDSAFLPSK